MLGSSARLIASCDSSIAKRWPIEALVTKSISALASAAHAGVTNRPNPSTHIENITVTLPLPGCMGRGTQTLRRRFGSRLSLQCLRRRYFHRDFDRRVISRYVGDIRIFKRLADRVHDLVLALAAAVGAKCCDHIVLSLPRKIGRARQFGDAVLAVAALALQRPDLLGASLDVAIGPGG